MKFLAFFICMVLLLSGCGAQELQGDSGSLPENGSSLSQSSALSSSDTTASQSSDAAESGSDVSMQPNRILALGDPILLNFPSDITVGTQSELDRWNELIGAGKVARIDVCNMNDTESELSGDIASTIIKTLIGAELGFYDTLGNPMTGGSFHVIAYDASGAILFQSSYDGEWFSVAFDSENTAYVFNGKGSSLDRLSKLLSSAISESRSEESAGNSFRERWSGFTDLSGRPFDLDGTAIQSFNLNYALGWNFDQEGYQKIVADSEVGGYTVGTASSSYSIWYQQNRVDCIANSYSLSRGQLMKGILKTNENVTDFYPYPNETGDNFLFLCERTEATEQEFIEASTIVLADGRAVSVQPIPIRIAVPKDVGDGTFLSSSTLEKLVGKTLVPVDHLDTVYLEAEVRFEPGSIEFHLIYEGYGDVIHGTEASGFVENVEQDIIITDFL